MTATPLHRYRREDELKNMSAVWVVADRIEIAIRDVDIQRDEAAGFEHKFRTALARRPKELVILLQAKALSTVSLGRLLRARADTVKEGIRFVLKPESPTIAKMVKDLGVDRILGLAA